jgi:1-acyl-sn-glycerol-3-phosphate acyltransferase
LRCEFRFGKPIDLSRFLGRTLGAATYRTITDEVMYELSQLSGQTYVDRYADRPSRPASESSAADVSSDRPPVLSGSPGPEG